MRCALDNSQEGVEKNKLFFVSWVPDVAKVKAKMLYASSKERFRRELDGAALARRPDRRTDAR